MNSGNDRRTLQSRLWSSYGVDVSSSAISSAITTHEIGKYYVLKNYDELEKYFCTDFFDIITMWEVIEHLEQPMPLLFSLRKYLRPGGVIVFSTPNVESFWAKILRDKWDGFHMPEHHLTYFTKTLLENALSRAGFTNVTVTTIPQFGAGYFDLSKNFAVGLIRKLFKSSRMWLKILAFCVTVVPCKIVELIAPKLNMAETLLALGQK